MRSIINKLEALEQKHHQEKFHLVNQREAAVMQLYNLRTMLEQKLRAKVPHETIVKELHDALIQVTPHGPKDAIS